MFLIVDRQLSTALLSRVFTKANPIAGHITVSTVRLSLQCIRVTPVREKSYRYTTVFSFPRPPAVDVFFFEFSFRTSLQTPLVAHRQRKKKNEITSIFRKRFTTRIRHTSSSRRTPPPPSPPLNTRLRDKIQLCGEIKN